MSSTAHAVVPTTGLCALNRGERRPHSRAVCPQTHKGIPTRGPRASTGHGGVSTRTTCALENAQRGPNSRLDILTCTRRASHPRAVCFQPRVQWSPPQASAASTAHAVVPTRGQCALKHTERVPTQGPRTIPLKGPTARGWVLKAVGVPSTAHQEFPTCGLCTLNRARSGPHHKAMRSQLPRRVHSWATSSQLGTERSPLADPWVVCLQLLTQWFPPAVHAPSTAQEQSPLACSAPSAQTEGASWAARPHPHMEGTPPAGRAPSTAHRGVPTPGPSTGHGGVPTAVPMPSTEHHGLPTRGPCTLNHARSGSPHHKAVRPQLL